MNESGWGATAIFHDWKNSELEHSLPKQTNKDEESTYYIAFIILFIINPNVHTNSKR